MTVENRKKLILHIGAGKCGSSALQFFLTRNSVLKRDPLPPLSYYSITKPFGLVLPAQHRERSRYVNHRFLNSIPFGALLGLGAEHHDEISKALASTPGDAILSCEGWFDPLQSQCNITSLLRILDPGDQFEVSILAFIRPPVKWINSGWWQWGAWSSITFEHWLDRAIRASTWQRTISALNSHPRISELNVLPMCNDIVDQFCATYGPFNKLSWSAKGRVNSSLPAEVLRLYQQIPTLRTDPHISGIDFSILTAISHSDQSFKPTPWILNLAQVSQILAHTRESNKQSLDYMQSSEREYVLSDPAWWDSGYYSSYDVESPYLEQPLEYADITKLVSAFAHGLHRARMRASKAGFS